MLVVSKDAESVLCTQQKEVQETRGIRTTVDHKIHPVHMFRTRRWHTLEKLLYF